MALIPIKKENNGAFKLCLTIGHKLNYQQKINHLKSTFIVSIICILSLNCFAQTNYENGYFINNANQKTECLIKNVDWKNNPTEFEYKLSINDEPRKIGIDEVQEFTISNSHKYQRFNVSIDRSSNNINRLDTLRNFVLHEEQLFLKTLVEGKASLYYYEDNIVKKFFYKIDASEVKLLKFKRYIFPTETLIRVNSAYKQQLLLDLICENISEREIDHIKYEKNSLTNLIVKFNECHNSTYSNYDKLNKKDLFNLSIRVGLNSSSLETKYNWSDNGNITFDNEVSPRFGLEFEYIFPFNNNKWSVTLEPSYQYYKTSKINNDALVQVDYKSVELPIGVRHYFFLNDKSKLFINGLYVLNFGRDSYIQFEENQDLALNVGDFLVLNGRSNLAIGGGYNFNNKVSIEARYGFRRELFRYKSNWASKYEMLSIMVGYSIF